MRKMTALMALLLCVPLTAQDPPENFQFNISTLQAFYFIAAAQIDGVDIEEGDWLAAFNGDVCVGANDWGGPYTEIPAMGFDGNPWTAGYMSNNLEPTFQIYDVSEGVYLDATALDAVPGLGWTNFGFINIGLLTAVGGGGPILGCTNPEACNFDPEAEEDDFSCLFDDCNGDCGGSADFDDCGVCAGGNTGLVPNADMDCEGTCFGSAYLDNCEVCDDNPDNDCEADCNGEFGGSAVIDDCGDCVLGTTGLDFNEYMDDCGICDGNNASMDCNGDCSGTAVENDCGCVGGNTGLDENWCYGCTDEEALNYDPDALYDDDSCYYEEVPELFAFNQSTSQAFYFIADAEIDGVDIEPGDWLAVFNGDICVGAASWIGPFTEIPAMGDDGNDWSEGYLTLNDVPTFMLYDLSEDLYYDAFASNDESELAWSNFAFINIDLLAAMTIIEGCTDEEACNFNPDANEDDGSCYYPDCAGVCDGSAYEDDCGVCDDNPQNDNAAMDCNGDCFGDALVDDCGICAGGNTGLLPNADQDECGVCFGDNADMDCNGDCFGTAALDNCGVCAGGLTGLVPDADMDCAGDCFGSAYVDNCGVCDDDPVNDCIQDCAGIWGGVAYEDLCGICDENPANDNADMDCNGDCFGTAALDDCDVCAGGNTGLVPNADLDDCGVCFGENGDMDCNGDCYGTAFIDDCGVCADGNTGLIPNADMDCAGDCFGDAYYDNCDVCDDDPGNDCNADCNGDYGGNATLDDCGICAGGNTGLEPNMDMDCNGDCFGDAFIDDCEICAGGYTGLEPNADMDCAGNCFGTAYYDQCMVCDDNPENDDECVGCTNPEAINYCEDCTIDDGYCFVTPELFEFSQSTAQAFYFIGTAYLGNLELEVGDWIATFNGDVCVGSNVWTGPFTEVPAMGNDGQPWTAGYMNFGDVPTFQIYDISSGNYFDAVPSDYIGNLGWSNFNFYNIGLLNVGLDCAGILGGLAYLDDCGQCVEGSTGMTENWALDCMELCFGTAFIDGCGVCSGGTSGHQAGSDRDCAGTCFGDAYNDNCGICVGGVTGLDPDLDMDCSGMCFGQAVVDDCGECTGGNTGLLFNFGLDNCGVCYGQNADMDCNGDCFGTAVVDDCNECVQGNTGLPFNFALDDCGVCYGLNSDMDCDGDCFGNAFIDNCGECVGGNTGLNPNFANLGCGCFLPAPNMYYPDVDGDGMGFGLNPVPYCVDPGAGWSLTNDDPEPLCASNDTDDCGICGGGNEDMDCFGHCFGQAEEDVCGECGGNGASCNRPVANNMSVNTSENTALTFEVDASDPNDDPIWILNNSSPAHGWLAVTGETLEVTYTPYPGYHGFDSFNYRVTDGLWNSSMKVVTINVLDVNDPPEVQSYTMNLVEDQIVTVGLIATDTDTRDSELSFEIVDYPSLGILEFDRAFDQADYIPAPDANGSDFFTYQAFDGENYSDLGMVILNIAPINDPPVLLVTGTPEDFIIDEETSLEFLVELFDVDGDIPTLQILSGPFNGQLTLIGDNEYNYTPNDGFSGSDNIVINTTDGLLQSPVTNISITVLNLNDPPACENVTAFLYEDTSKLIELVGWDGDGDPLLFPEGFITPPAHGTMTYYGDVVFYEPNDNYFGPDVFTYRVFDGQDYCEAACSAIIEVIPVNDEPVAQPLSFEGVEDGFIFELDVFDADGDDLDIFFVPTDPQNEGFGNTVMGGSVSPVGDGTYQYNTPAFPPDNDYIFYKAMDEQSESDLVMISFAIPAGLRLVDRGSPFAVDQDISVTEDICKVVRLIGVDVGAGFDETSDIIITQDPSMGYLQWIQIDPDQSNNNILTFVASYCSNADASGLDSLKFAVDSGTEERISPEATMSFDVNEINDAPSLDEIGDQDLNEDATMILPLTIVDPDNEVEVTWTTTNANELNITFDADNSQLVIIPAENFFGEFTITVFVTEIDGEDFLQTSQTFKLNVQPVNDEPVMVDPGTQDINEDQIILVNLEATDVDEDDIAYYRVEFLEDGRPADWVNLNLNLDGVVVGDFGDPTNLLTIIPADNKHGNIGFSVFAFDENNMESQGQDFGLLVNPVNDNPFAPDIPNQETNENNRADIVVYFNPTDVDEDDILTVTAGTNNPNLLPVGSIVVEPETAVQGTEREITLSPVAEAYGNATITVSVDDGTVVTTSTFTVTVNNENDTPVLAAIGNQSLSEDHTLTIELDASDVDNAWEDLTFTATTEDQGIAANVNGNEVTFTPEANFNGINTFVITVTDGLADAVELIEVSVSEVNDAPVITTAADPEAYTGQIWSYQVGVDDVDDSEFTYSLSNEPTGMSVSGSGEVTWQPETGTTTSGNVTLTVSDGDLTDSEAFILTVFQLDCVGDINGTAFVDNCGICVGGTTGLAENYAMDCAGDCFGTAANDDCGVCSGGTTGHIANSDDLGCGCFQDEAVMYYADTDGDGLGVGDAISFCTDPGAGWALIAGDPEPNCQTNDTDDCGVCGGNNADMDCNQDCFGAAFIDDCLICSGGQTGHAANSEKDCNGTCFGEAALDECGICAGGETGLVANADMDCADVCFGAAFLDDCEVCSGGITNHPADSDKDCSGLCFGEAVIDDCGVCSSGSTGVAFNADMDCSGLCFGTAVIDDCGVCTGGTTGVTFNVNLDCAGVCFGEATVNECGCVLGTTNLDADWCYGCTDPEAQNFCPECTIDDGSCTPLVTILIELHEGNNLVSFSALPDENSPGNILSPLGDNILTIIGEGVNAIPHPLFPDQWIGSLSGIDPSDGYWVRVVTEDILQITGWPSDPLLEYNLHLGNNLISYVGESYLSVSEALPDDIEPFVETIIGEGVNAVPHPLFPDVWIGSMSYFERDKGYWMRTSQDISFTWDNPGLVRQQAPVMALPEVPDEFSFAQSSRQAFYYVDEVTIEGQPLLPGDWLLAYSGETVVGARQWTGEYTDIPAMGADGAIDTEGYLAEGEVPHFKVYLETTGDLIPLTTQDIAPFQSNETFFLNGLTEQALLPEYYRLHNAYPNPFNPTTTVGYDLPQEGVVEIVIYDVQGRIVAEMVNEHQTAGYHQMVWNANEQASGVYILRMSSGDFMSTQKVMLVK